MPCRCVPAVDVTIYRSSSTEEVRQVQEYFNRKGIAYEIFDVSSDPAAISKMQELSGQTERPVTSINDRILVGYIPDQFDLLVPSLHD